MWALLAGSNRRTGEGVKEGCNDIPENVPENRLHRAQT